MNAKMILAVGAAMMTGLAFGYGNDDKDANGNAYSSDAYVQLLNSAASFNQALTDGSFWSDGQTPHSDADYYIVNGKYIRQQNSTFPGKSLTVGASGQWYYYNGTITISDFRLRVNSRTINWWADTGNTTMNGKLTLLADGSAADNRSLAPVFEAGKKGATMNMAMKLVSPAGGYVRFQRYYEAATPHNGTYATVNVTGDGSDFYGTILVGSDVHFNLGNGGLPNGGVEVTGECYAGKYQNTDLTYTEFGICATDGNPVSLKTLKLAEGARVKFDTLDANDGQGLFVSDTYTQEGPVIFDFGNVLLPKANYFLLTVPASATLDLDNITIEGLIDSSLELSIQDGGDVKTLMLTNPDPKDYITMTGSDKIGGAYTTTLYFGPGTWSDGQEVHADGDYLVNKGEWIFFPISWTYLSNEGTGLGGGNNAFRGKSLTINGGSVVTAGNGTPSDTYNFVVNNLILAGGADIHTENGDQCKFSVKSTITVKGEATIKNGHNWDNSGNRSGMLFFNKFVGDANARLTMQGNSSCKNPAYVSQLIGDTTGFEGVVLFKDWNATTKIGRYGFENASVTFDSYDPDRASLGVTNNPTDTLSMQGAYIPFKDLAFNMGGMKIKADELVQNNGGYGFKVTGEYNQNGTLIFDFAEVALAQKNVNLLCVPEESTVTIDDFEIVNQTTPGYTLSFKTDGGFKTLTLSNPNMKNYVKLLGGDPWMSVGQSSFVTNVLQSGRGWSDAQDPHAGADYLVDSGYTLRLPQDGEVPCVFAGDSLTLDKGIIEQPNWSNTAPNGTTAETTIDDLVVKAGFLRLGAASPTKVYGQFTFDTSAYPDEPNAVWYYSWTGRHDIYAKWVSGKDELVRFTSGTTAKNGSPTVTKGLMIPGDPATTHSNGKYSYCNYFGNIKYYLEGDFEEFLGTLETSWGSFMYLDTTSLFAGTLLVNNAGELDLGFALTSGIQANKVVSRDSTVVVKTGVSASIESLDMDWATVESHVVDNVDVYYGTELTDSTDYPHVHFVTNKYAGANTVIPMNRLYVRTGGQLTVKSAKLVDTLLDLEADTSAVTFGDLDVSGDIVWPVRGNLIVNGTFTSDHAFEVKPTAGKRFTLVMGLGAEAKVDLSLFSLPANLPTDQYVLKVMTVNGVNGLYIEDMGCTTQAQYDAAMWHSDYYWSGSSNPEEAANANKYSSFVDGYHWQYYTAGVAGDKGTLPTAEMDAIVYCGAIHTWRKNAEGKNVMLPAGTVFPGRSFTLCAHPSNKSTESILRIDNGGLDITIPDFRVIQNSRIYLNYYGGGTATIRGDAFRVLTTAQDQFWVKGANATGVACLKLCAPIIGGETRSMFISNNTLDKGLVRVEFCGDASNYAGEILAKTNSVIALMNEGVPNGTIAVEETGTGLAVATTATVKDLSLADGKTIAFEDSGNLTVTGKLAFGGKVVLDFTKAKYPAGKTTTVMMGSESFMEDVGGFDNVQIETQGLPANATFTAAGPFVQVTMPEQAGLVIIFK